MPAGHYPHGYQVRVTGGTAAPAAKAQVVNVTTAPGATAVVVTITRSA